MHKESLLQKLDELRTIVKQSKTGGDLYEGFKNYSRFVLDNWPEGMADRQGWIKEMEFTLEKLESKKGVKSITQSKDLPSFKQDAEEVMHHYDCEFTYYFSRKD